MEETMLDSLAALPSMDQAFDHSAEASCQQLSACPRFGAIIGRLHTALLCWPHPQMQNLPPTKQCTVTHG
jgi:hypothetical protein